MSRRRDVFNATVALSQTALQDYRQAFLEILVDRLDDRFCAYAGSEYFDRSTRTNVSLGSHLQPLRNHFILGRRLLWQCGAVRPMTGVDVALLEFNPRIISVWVILGLRFVLRRPSLLWGHAWSRSGGGSRSEPVRMLMRRLARGVILYTSSQAKDLSAHDPRTRTFVAPNALYRASQMRPAPASRVPDSFIYVGRLVPTKKPHILIDAFIKALPDLPHEMRLVIVGDGPLMQPLRERAAATQHGKRIEFLGHLSDPLALERLYRDAVASVSPGFVGLSITQSLGFGVPMIIARNEPHSPELEAARDGWNASIYEPSTYEALSSVLVAFARDRQMWAQRRESIALDCRRRYSAEAMADGFMAAIREVARA